jgi:hypothetical protein
LLASENKDERLFGEETDTHKQLSDSKMIPTFGIFTSFTTAQHCSHRLTTVLQASGSYPTLMPYSRALCPNSRKALT